MTHENRQAARELIPTRESLLSRLRAWDDQVSWQAFFDTYGALIFSTAIKAGLSAEEAQDVVQETVIAAARSLPKFHYDPAKGSFKGWLLTLTRWRIVAEVRKRQKNISMPWSDACNESPPVEQVSDPAGDPLEALWDAEWEHNLAEAAIDRVKKKVDAKHYQIFDFHVVKKWPVTRVARALNINPAAVYLIKHRISKLIKKEVEYLRTKPL